MRLVLPYTRTGGIECRIQLVYLYVFSEYTQNTCDMFACQIAYDDMSLALSSLLFLPLNFNHSGSTELRPPFLLALPNTL